jgi:hypothetical protein
MSSGLDATFSGSKLEVHSGVDPLGQPPSVLPRSGSKSPAALGQKKDTQEVQL